MKFIKARVHKILIIKIAAIGDVLLSTPVIENLRNNFPNARIDYLTQSYCRDMVYGNPYLDRVLTFNAETDSGWCLVKTIKEKNYDLIIDLFGNPRTALITFYSRAKYRVGYRFNYRAIAYNIKIKPRSGTVHNIEFNLDALRSLGLEIKTSTPLLYIDNYFEKEADRIFTELGLEDKQVIAVNPAGTWQTKVWYKEKFSELIELLSDKYSILLTWGNEKERILAEEIRAQHDKNVQLIPFAGLKTLGAILKKCTLFISNDTGPMHIAWVLGVKTAAIFGPTSSEFQGPVTKNSIKIRNEELLCLGCGITELKDCPNEHKCMKYLNSKYVYDKIINFLESEV